MKVLRPILILIGLAAGLGLVIAAALPSHYYVERSVEVARPSISVFQKVSDLGGCRDWCPWFESEPGAEFVFEGPSRQVGARLRWNGKILGKASYTLIALAPQSEIRAKLETYEPHRSFLDHSWTFQELGPNRTRIVWGIEGDLLFPIERLIGSRIERKTGAEMEKTLQRLKISLEARK